MHGRIVPRRRPGYLRNDARLRVAVSRMLLRRGLRFALTGLLSTAVHVTVASLLIELAGSHPAAANGAAFVASVFVSYWVNTLWSFSQRPSRESFLRFVVVCCAGFVLAVGLSGFAAWMQWHYLVGIGLVVLAVPPLNFLMHHSWTYRSRS